MPNRPDIDPNWMRRRRQPERDYTVVGLALAACLVLGLAAYWLYSNMATSQSAPMGASPVPEASVDMERRRRLEEQQQVIRLQQEASERQVSEAGGTGSSINGRSIYRCVYAGTESLQVEPCASPWVDAGQFEQDSRQDRIEDQEQMRRAAEAKLRLEEQRFAAAAGLESGSQVFYPSAPATTRQTRCAIAKAERDRAYERVGNNRTFDFIRYWNDVIFEACKGT